MASVDERDRALDVRRAGEGEAAQLEVGLDAASAGARFARCTLEPDSASCRWEMATCALFASAQVLSLSHARGNCPARPSPQRNGFTVPVGRYMRARKMSCSAIFGAPGAWACPLAESAERLDVSVEGLNPERLDVCRTRRRRSG